MVSNFDSNNYQRYVSKVRSIILDIARVNQDLLNCEQNFAKDNFEDYRNHMTNLLSAKSPLDYFRLNREYMESSMQKVARLVEKHKTLFLELNDRLTQESDSLACLLPTPIQTALKDYRENGVVPYVPPAVWKEFVEKFKY